MAIFPNIAIMSPNRYYCLGLHDYCVSKGLVPTNIYFCHSLKELQQLMEETTVSGLILELFGDNESIYDSFAFGDYLKGYPVNIEIMMINSLGRLKVDCSFCRRARNNGFPSALYEVSKYCQCNNYPSQWDNLLTKREYQVIKLLCYGKQSRQISEELGVSVKTVSMYKISALKKLGCSSMYSLFLKVTNQSKTISKF